MKKFLKEFTEEKEIFRRKGCKDVFNSYMLEGATYCKNDIPFCPTKSLEIPKKLIAYDLINSSTDKDAYVHFYIDDQKFHNIWKNPDKALEKIKNFAGMITPDFSTNQDFPDPLKRYNTYRMRAFGYYASTKYGINVINNVRFGTKETYEYCFEGIPQNSTICIGTIGCIKEKRNWNRIHNGMSEMIKHLNPANILVYGNAPEKFFKEYEQQGINIYVFPSQTQLAFDKRRLNNAK